MEEASDLIYYYYEHSEWISFVCNYSSFKYKSNNVKYNFIKKETITICRQKSNFMVIVESKIKINSVFI